MVALFMSRAAAHLRTRKPSRASEYLQPSPALASLHKPLLVSGILTAVAVLAAQLILLGPVSNFASLWVENWLVSWAIAAPVVYLLEPLLKRTARFLAAPVSRTDESAPGLAFTDIVAASSRARQRHGFTVLRNLKVREDFYPA